jgi:hypothetical protein
MKNRYPNSLLILSLAVLAVMFLTPAQAEVKGSFLYDLSTLTGTAAYSAPRLSVDRERNEVSVLYQNSVSVFNENGMEIYRFGDDLDLGQIVDISVDGDGNILVLSYRMSESGNGVMKIVCCNFRGEPTGTIELTNLPAGFSDFGASRMVYHKGTLYLASLSQLKVVLTDAKGNFQKGYDLLPLLGLKEAQRSDTEMIGFGVNEDGSIVFTVPVLFAAYTLSPEGKLASFGKPGGAPGRFNIVAGIVTDSRGNYLVVDKLKCTVMVFDKDFNYLSQFGFRGKKPGNLIAPEDIVIDKGGRVYVTQTGRRGVSVYQVTYN